MPESEVKKRLKKIRWRMQIGFECYGVKVGFRADAIDLEAKLKGVFPEYHSEIDFEEASDVLSLIVGGNNSENGLYFNNETAMGFEKFDDSLLEFLGDKILTILALLSLPSKFYIHAGAVSWNGFGIIIPGVSYAGKTTLVKEFIKAGAGYFSDDCVILDNQGYLLPFSRPLAIRTEEGRILKNAADFGAESATAKIKLWMVLLTKYEKDAVWRPEAVSKGQGILELMKNFYYQSSVREAPGEIIGALNNITRQTFIIGGKRDEARLVVEWFLENFPKQYER